MLVDGKWVSHGQSVGFQGELENYGRDWLGESERMAALIPGNAYQPLAPCPDSDAYGGVGVRVHRAWTC